MTAETKFTPGPWVKRAAGVDATMVTTVLGSGRRVSFRVAVCKDGDRNTAEANAHLIAAAPAMYAEVEQCAMELEEAAKLFAGVNQPRLASLFRAAAERASETAKKARGEP